MSRATCTLKAVPRHPDLAGRTRDALRHQGWIVESQDEGLVAFEDFSRLCCIESPVTVTVTFSELVEIEATAPGRGPVSSRNAHGRLAAVARAVVDANRTTFLASADEVA